MNKFEMIYITTGIVLGLIYYFNGNVFVQVAAFLSAIVIYLLRTIIEAKFFQNR